MENKSLEMKIVAAALELFAEIAIDDQSSEEERKFYGEKFGEPPATCAFLARGLKSSLSEVSFKKTIEERPPDNVGNIGECPVCLKDILISQKEYHNKRCPGSSNPVAVPVVVAIEEHSPVNALEEVQSSMDTQTHILDTTEMPRMYRILSEACATHGALAGESYREAINAHAKEIVSMPERSGEKKSWADLTVEVMRARNGEIMRPIDIETIIMLEHPGRKRPAPATIAGILRNEATRKRCRRIECVSRGTYRFVGVASTDVKTPTYVISTPDVSDHRPGTVKCNQCSEWINPREIATHKRAKHGQGLPPEESPTGSQLHGLI